MPRVPKYISNIITLTVLTEVELLHGYVGLFITYCVNSIATTVILVRQIRNEEGRGKRGRPTGQPMRITECQDK